MKFRSKIFLSFIALSAIGMLLSGAVLYVKMRSVIVDLIEDQIYAVSDTIPPFIDKDLLRRILEKKGEDRDDYAHLKGQLEGAAEVNKEKYNTIPFRDVFIAIPGDDREHIIIVADGIKEEEQGYQFGDTMKVSSKLYDRLNEAFVSGSMRSENGDRWYSGYAPIRDEKSNYLATLVVEVNAQAVHRELMEAITFLLAVGMLSLLVALIMAAILSHVVTRSLEVIEEGVEKIEKGDYSAQIVLHSEDEFEHLGSTINHMVHGLTERDRLKSGFAHYVSEYVLNQVLRSEKHFFEGERKKVTILFSDIRGFTELAEHLPAERTVALLNEYYELMIDVVFANKGTLDKFLGDGLMVMFGAPLDDFEQEKNAVQTAVDMQKVLIERNAQIQEEGGTPIQVGIGIHTGLAVVGNVGSQKRMEYTAIGDTVNIAARIEALTKTYEDDIIVTEETVKPLEDTFVFQSFGKVRLKGRSKEVGIYGLPRESYL